MDHETDSAHGPDPADWLSTAFRGLHPIRWLLGTVGVLLSLVVAIFVQSLFTLEWPDWAAWWTRPATQLVGLHTTLVGGSLVQFLFRGSVLLVLLTAVWCPLCCWITRHELLARQTTVDDVDRPTRIAPSTLVFRSRQRLLACGPIVVALTLLFLLPALLAHGLNSSMGGFGAILVALLLPIVLITNLIVVLLSLGVFAWPLMPTAIAAECSDVFDALSRSYNYAYQQPFRFVLLWACSVAIAAIPFVVFSYLEPLLNLPETARSACYLVVLGLSLAIFNSLQALVYLHLRTLVDDIGADVLVDNSPDSPPPNPPATPAAKPVEKHPPSIVTSLGLVGVAVGAWCLTYGLFQWASHDDSAVWLGWGFHDGFVPPAEGLYRIASLIALVWGILWVLWPIIMYARALRKNSIDNEPIPAVEDGPPT